MHMKSFRVVAKTLFGFEDLLAEELTGLGIADVVKATRAVSFEASQEQLYKVNLWSRLALRFMVPLHSFPCAREKELYDAIRAMEWERYMDVEGTLAVDAVTNRSAMDHSLYVSLKTKDAIVDRFRDRTGKRPSVDLNSPSLRINIHLSGDQATVSLDSSGDSLHKRGYRKQQGEAPLNEVLAAGMVKLSGWNGQTPLLDLLCGSGTIVIEAALAAGRRAPGLFRPEFGFERWKDFDATAWDALRKEARAAATSVQIPITAVDQSASAIRRARENAAGAGIDEFIEWIPSSFEDFSPAGNAGTIICNPPYGARLSSHDLLGLYKSLGDTFKKKYAGYEAWVLTANSEAAKNIGLRPSRKIQLFNGSLECRFLKFEMYAGTKKVHKLSPPV